MSLDYIQFLNSVFGIINIFLNSYETSLVLNQLWSFKGEYFPFSATLSQSPTKKKIFLSLLSVVCECVF